MKKIISNKKKKTVCSKSKSNFGKNSASKKRKSSMKKSTSKSSGESILKPNLTSSKNASDGLKTDRLHCTQKPHYIAPQDEYYNLATTRIAKKKKPKQSQVSIYFHPLLDQMSKAVDDLMNLTQKQEK